MWQPDTEVTSCACGARFSLFVRRHHCRLCRKVYCDNCTLQRAFIPSFIQTVEETTKVRLCSTCFHACEETTRSEPLVRVMALLPVGVKTLGNLALNKTWWRANKTLLRVYRNLPLKMPFDRFSRLETCLLKTHLHRVGGHPSWDLQVVRALKCTPAPRTCTCAEIGCKTCPPRNIVFELLTTFPNTHLLRTPSVATWLGEKYMHMPAADIIMYMPWWLRRSLTPSAQRFLETYLLPRCSRRSVAYAFYFECKLYSDPVYASMATRMLEMHPDHKKDILRTETLVEYVNGLVRGERHIVDLPARVPYDPSLLVHSISEPKKLSSATAPSVVVFHTNNGVRRILVKNESMEKDRLVMVAAHLVETLCHTRCVQYPVFVTKNVGWVQMLDDAKTLHELRQGLSSHVFNEFATSKIRVVRRRFINSAIGACVLSYLLGVGDRHLENMVVSHGEIAHVDFSYLLGHDPKLSIDIRITTPMVLLMGGAESVDYAFFVKGVTDAFAKLRDHAGLWYALLTYLEGEFRLADIQRHVTEKLMSSLQDGEATMRIVDIVKHSSNTWRHSMSDLTHQIFQMDF